MVFLHKKISSTHSFKFTLIGILRRKSFSCFHWEYNCLCRIKVSRVNEKEAIFLLHIIVYFKYTQNTSLITSLILFGNGPPSILIEITKLKGNKVYLLTTYYPPSTPFLFLRSSNLTTFFLFNSKL